MTLALPYPNQPTASVSEFIDIPEVFFQAIPSILGRLYNPVNNATSDIKVTSEVSGTDLRLVTQTLERADFEEALGLVDAVPPAPEMEWDTVDDFIIPFTPKWSAKSTAKIHFGGRLAPEIVDVEKDYID